MIKQISISLAGKTFDIEEKAYTLLAAYFDKQKLAYQYASNPQQLSDRLEEEFAQWLSTHADPQEAISANLINNAIAHHAETDTVEQEPPESDNSTYHFYKTKSKHADHQPIPKRLFRNPHGRLLGGVFSGLSIYTDQDVILLRLIALALTLFLPYLIIVYVIAWLIIPEAISEKQRFEMLGGFKTDLETQPKQKRLYRDPKQRILGGVASGIAHYFRWDVNAIRLALLAIGLSWILIPLFPFLTFFSVSNGLIYAIYLILWLVTPEAITQAQREEMLGNSLPQDIPVGHNDPDHRNAQDALHEAESGFGKAMRGIFKTGAGCMGVSLGCLGLVIFIPILFITLWSIFGLLGLPFLPSLNIPYFWNWNLGDWHFDLLVPDNFFRENLVGKIGATSTVLTVIIPILFVIIFSVKRIFRMGPISRFTRWFLLSLWIISLILTIIFGSWFFNNAINGTFI